jgi:hypothetical protein
MVQQGLVVLSDADVIKYTHSLTNQQKKKEAQK